MPTSVLVMDSNHMVPFARSLFAIPVQSQTQPYLANVEWTQQELASIDGTQLSLASVQRIDPMPCQDCD